MDVGLVVLIGLVTVANSILLIALARQVGLLQLRVAPVGALEGLEGAISVGERIAMAERLAWDQFPMSQAGLLAFASPRCSVCGDFMKALRAYERGKRNPGVGPIAVVVEDAPSEAERYVRQFDLTADVIAIGPNALPSVGVPGTPYIVIAEPGGLVVGAGGVNTLEQLETLVEESFLRMAHDTVSAPPLDAVAHADQHVAADRGGLG